MSIERIEYQEFGSERIEEVYKIYEENEWTSYLGDKDKLVRAFDRSLYILGAFDDNKLVGFVRCVGDDEYIVYVQDIVVLSAYHRKGIGRELMKRVSERYPLIHQFVLITDQDDEVSNAFYKAIGMSENCNGYPINHYFRIKNNE